MQLSLNAKRAPQKRRGVILLAVLIFIALLLPLVTLVLTSINTESVATAEAIKGAKADMASEKAMNDAISLVVQEKAFPSYWTSQRQPNTAIIVVDQATGFRRDEMPDSGAVGGAGLDNVLGTNDDYWMGPRYDRSYNGANDPEDNSRMYRYEFAFDSVDAPVYLGQSWSQSPANRSSFVSSFTGGTMWMLNQYAGVQADQDAPADGVDEGYDVANADPFNGNYPGILSGPGYYLGSDEPRVAGPGSAVNRDIDTGNSIKDYMFNAKVNLYESIFSDLDRGPIPTSLLKSYASVTDEAGRVNLNIFLKKVRVWMPESAETDYDLDGYGTNDYNGNETVDESGWKWVDNPLFPDRYTTVKWDFDPTAETFAQRGGSFQNSNIDWGSMATDGTFSSSTDDISMPQLGENAQHFYQGDIDGDGIGEGVEACRSSLEMLMTLPGMTGQMAANLLEYMNPTQDYFADLASARGLANPTDYYNPNGGTWPPTVDAVNNIYREDACNLTPALLALEVTQAGGVVTDFRWGMDFSEEDDLPLPPPHPLTSFNELVGGSGTAAGGYRSLIRVSAPANDQMPYTNSNRAESSGIPGGVIEGYPESAAVGPRKESGVLVQDVFPAYREELLTGAGFTQAQADRLSEQATIFSYDTNVLATNVQDVSEDADLVNAYVPGDPQYSGAALRATPEDLQDTDNVPDLRFDVDRFVFGVTLSDYRRRADEMYAHLREHMNRPSFDKFTLPVVDRLGRAGAEDNLVDNGDTRYDPTAAGGQNQLYVPHRDAQARVYNVGALGREDDPDGGGPALATGYPALNPEFSIDSCLSIVLYRNGSLLEEDDYSYNPNNGAFPPAANRGLLNLFPFGVPWFVNVLGPFGSQLQYFLEANNDPQPFAGNNVNPQVRAHGNGVFEFNNMLQAGSFDTPADLLNVPQYSYGRMSVSLMADPPSDFRFDSNGNGTVQGAVPGESGVVNYYVAFSDVVDASWYLANVDPDGPDQLPGTGDDPPMNVPLYRLVFNSHNRPGASTPARTCIIPLTAMQLRAVGGGAESGRSMVTIAAWDNFNNLDVIGPAFTANASFAATLGPLGASGTLAQTFNWRQVPLPEENASAGAVGADADGRPLAAADYHNSNPLVPVADRQAFAYDANGDPYLTSRVEAIAWDSGTNAPAQPEMRSDENTRVYLQYNQTAQVPFRVDILPVRVGGDEYEVRSSFGGADVDGGGAYLLYDWSYEDNADTDTDPDSVDGTWPVQQVGQVPNPQVVRIRPETGQITLRVYDLRTFTDNAPGVTLPVATGFALPGGIWAGDRVNYPPLFPDDPAYLGTYPLAGTGGYAEDTVLVQQIESPVDILPEIAVQNPSMYQNDDDLEVRYGAVGGRAPYTYTISVLDAADGGPGDTPYAGPDGAGPIASYPGLGTPPRPSLITAPGVAYDKGGVGTGDVILPQSFTSNNPEEDRLINTGGLAAGEYWVELQVTDSSAVPITRFAYTKLSVGTDNSPSDSSGLPPEMNTSINLRDLGEGRKGFVASASVDGGSGGYSYYWEVHRPIYDNSNPASPVLVDEQLVDSAAPFVGIDAQGIPSNIPAFTSNEANPSFEFQAIDAANGVYFVHCWVIDQRGGSPNVVQPNMAHDVAMVTINDAGSSGGTGGIPIDSLSRTPMAVLAANPPGNSSTPLGNNSIGSTGTNRPYIGVSPTYLNQSALEPDVAGRGDVVIIRGFNFDATADNNVVRFGGDVTARAFRVQTVVGNNITINGNNYVQQELFVVVPNGARTGNLNVSTPGGTSQAVFFQTGYVVNFDLIGKMSPDDPSYLRFDLDYQGDGKYDFSYNTQANPDQSGIVRASDQAITHDYASDGVGNYNATLKVTDLVSGRVQMSHQLITIKDRRPATSGQLTIASGTVTQLGSGGGALPGATFTDSAQNFDSVGLNLGTDLIYNITTSPTSGQTINGFADGEIQCSGTWNVGDVYEVRRAVDQANINSMLVNTWPDIDLRSDTFTPDPGSGTVFHSAVGGVSSTGLQYKWLIDENRSGGDVGGSMLFEGEVDDVVGGVNAPVAADLSRRLIDNNVNFSTVAGRGVQEGDLVLITEKRRAGTGVTPANARANVRTVESNNQLLLSSPANINVGLTGGGALQRRGRSDNATPSQTLLIGDNNNNTANWNFYGLNNGFEPNLAVNIGFNDNRYWGGVIVGDLVSNQQYSAGGTFNVTSVPTAAPLDRINVAQVSPNGTATRIAIARNTTLIAPPPIGAPNTYLLQLSRGGGTPIYNTLNLWPGFNIGDQVLNTANGQVFTVVAIAVNTITVTSNTLVGTIANGNSLRIQGIDPFWLDDDQFFINFAANQMRVGFHYRVFASNGLTADAEADATYASQNAKINFDIQATYPFDLTANPVTPTLVEIDWDGSGSVDQTFAIGDTTRLDGAINEFDVERVRASHVFQAIELDANQQTQAQYRLIYTRLNQPAPITTGFFALPVVTVGRDDVDTDLRNLNVLGYDSSSSHNVGLQTHYTQVTSQSLFGVSVPTFRLYNASDALYLPAGLDSYADTLTTFASYSRPFIFNNAQGQTNMKHQAVHGAGGALNWMSDANADGVWNPSSSSVNNFESPQGLNPVNYHEFTFPNGPNDMLVPNGNTIKGASFPLAVPGAGTTGVGSFNYYRARRGLYNGYGFVSDNLPQDSRAFSFDSQAIFLGDRINSGSAQLRPLAADFYVDPPFGSNSNLFQLTSYVTGGATEFASYNYRWLIQYEQNPGVWQNVGVDGAFGAGPSSTAINAVFSPSQDIRDEAWYAGEDGSGNFRAWLLASDGAGTAASPLRVFQVEAPNPAVYVMANPPSTTTGAEVQFHVFVDGGQAPYRARIDYDQDGTFDQTLEIYQGNEITFSHVYTEPSSDLDGDGQVMNDQDSDYRVTVEMVDSPGAAPDFDGPVINNQTIVKIADNIPLNANLLVNPPSGVAPMLVDAHYTVAGGSPVSNNEYNITLQLINTNGTAGPAVTRSAPDTFGANGVLDDPRLPTSDDEPVQFVVPESGNYFIQLTVTDNDGKIVTVTEDVFASGYFMPVQYGDTTPRVLKDGNGRPMHAVRVWVDPFINVGGGASNVWQNDQASPANGAGGGRLMEADLQVFGDAIMTDPSANFRSLGVYATKNPAEQPLYFANYSVAGDGTDLVQDFYDTFTPGRININTASEDTLTALFRKIITRRAYLDHNSAQDRNGDGDTADAGERFRYIDTNADGNNDWLTNAGLDGDGDGDFADERYRNVRDYASDVYMTEAEARRLAREVVRYRSAFYDIYKPTPPDGGTAQFGYQRNGSGDPDLGSFRVDHLPVIGPWDGVNPHDYEIDNRNAQLKDADDGDMHNAYDNIAGSYYNLDPSTYMFYSPTDVAVVRDRYQAIVNIDNNGDGDANDAGDSRFVTFEAPGNYAKYLNDVVSATDFWQTGRGAGTGWDQMGGAYQFSASNPLSRWGFDARNYFSYSGGQVSVQINGVTGALSVTPLSGVGSPAEARNDMSIIASNGETAYTYIPNPPFRHVFDLFKVIDDSAGGNTFGLTSNQLTLATDRTTATGGLNSFTNVQRFSGPSLFRYSAHWDDDRSEFVPVQNYLDDIAPYITCRSYVFRVDSAGAVVASGGDAGALVDSAKVSRSRSKSAVIDTGKLYSRRSGSQVDQILSEIFGLETNTDTERNYRVLWLKDER
ncbi:hypothetical protein IT575_03290 [bacterium]|nr:hypothetical protein [bacterium]